MNSAHPSWKSRFELPVVQKLDLKFSISKLLEELDKFSDEKVWDGLGNEYASLCETHTKLPKMFFNESELKGVKHVCDLDWRKTSYQQLSLTEYDETYSLEKRSERSNSPWDHRIAKNSTLADERWFRKIKEQVPAYTREVLNSFPNAHRARLAKLAPHSQVKPHIDYDTLYGIRLHIPLKTNEFCFNGGWDKDGTETKIHMPADGHAWFVNPGLKHYAINNGDTERVHLIISVDSHEPLSFIK
jgi:hypothetical protein